MWIIDMENTIHVCNLQALDGPYVAVHSTIDCHIGELRSVQKWSPPADRSP